jgi:hypothetical protein
MSEAVEASLRDAGRWVSGVAEELGRSPWPVPFAVVVAGLVVLLFGARARRPVAVAGAAGAAALAAQWLATRPGLTPPIPVSTLTAVAAAVCGALAVVVPQIFPALVGALPGALLAELLVPPDRRLEGIAAGALLGALLGFAGSRLVASAVASGLGAVAVAVGAMGALRGTASGRVLQAHPTATLAAALILAIAGTAFQFSRAWGRGSGAPPAKGPAAPVKGPAEQG